MMTSNAGPGIFCLPNNLVLPSVVVLPSISSVKKKTKLSIILLPHYSESSKFKYNSLEKSLFHSQYSAFPTIRTLVI